MTGQELYRLARDSGWSIERIRRMKGTSVVVGFPDGERGAFGHAGAGVETVLGYVPGLDRTGELSAWKELAFLESAPEND